MRSYLTIGEEETFGAESSCPGLGDREIFLPPILPPGGRRRSLFPRVCPVSSTSERVEPRSRSLSPLGTRRRWGRALSKRDSKLWVGSSCSMTPPARPLAWNQATGINRL